MANLPISGLPTGVPTISDIIPFVQSGITKLVPADSGSPCHPDNVAVIVSEHKPHQKWTRKTYEPN